MNKKETDRDRVRMGGRGNGKGGEEEDVSCYNQRMRKILEI